MWARCHADKKTVFAQSCSIFSYPVVGRFFEFRGSSPLEEDKQRLIWPHVAACPTFEDSRLRRGSEGKTAADKPTPSPYNSDLHHIRDFISYRNEKSQRYRNSARALYGAANTRVAGRRSKGVLSSRPLHRIPFGAVGLQAVARGARVAGVPRATAAGRPVPHARRARPIGAHRRRRAPPQAQFSVHHRALLASPLRSGLK